MRTRVLIALYLAAIVAANLLVVTLGPQIAVLNAFLFIGLDLTTRDALHEAWRGPGLAWKMAVIIAAGSILSYALNRDAGQIALASFVAFGASASLDAATYALLGDRAYLIKVNGSNIVGALVDSIIFPALAFGLPLAWPIVAGLFVAKVIGGAVWSIVLGRTKAQEVTP